MLISDNSIKFIRIKRLLSENTVNPNIGKIVSGLRACIENELQNNNKVYVCFRPANYRFFREQYQYETFIAEDMIGYLYRIDDSHMIIAVTHKDTDGRIHELVTNPEQYVAEIVSRLNDDGTLMNVIAIWVQRSEDGCIYESKNEK